MGWGILNVLKFAFFRSRLILSVCQKQRSVSARPLRPLSLAIYILAAGVLPLLLSCNTYNPNLGASPTVSSSISLISPSSKTAGSADFTLFVEGSGFVSGSNVTWSTSGSPTVTNLANPTFVDANHLTATVTAALVANPGTFSVGVLGPGPTQGNGAGNNISNFWPFYVCASGSPCPTTSALPGASARVITSGAPVSAPRFVALVSASADAGANQVFLQDTCLGAQANCLPQAILISVGFDGSEANGASRSPSVTSGGRFVAFASDATNLVPGDANGWSDIFVRDTCIGAASPCSPTTTRVSVGSRGEEANGSSSAPAIDPAGRFVAFDSLATNLAQDSSEFTGTPRLFLRDTCFQANGPCAPVTARVQASR